MKTPWRVDGREKVLSLFVFVLSGKPLFIGMDINIASFDSISEVNMVSDAYLEALNIDLRLLQGGNSLVNLFSCKYYIKRSAISVFPKRKGGVCFAWINAQSQEDRFRLPFFI